MIVRGRGEGERTGILKLDFVELLLVWLLGAGEDSSVELTKVGGVLAGEQTHGDLCCCCRRAFVHCGIVSFVLSGLLDEC